MSFLQSFLQKIQDSRKRKEEERYRIQQLRNEAAAMERIEFERQKRIQLRDYAINLARQEVAMKTGIAKLRAERKLRYLQEKPLNFSDTKSDRFREYRLRNLQRTANNHQRVEEMRRRIKEQKLLKLRDSQVRREFANQKKSFRPIHTGSLRKMPFEPRGWGK